MFARLAAVAVAAVTGLFATPVMAEVSSVGYRRFEATDAVDGAKIQGGLWFPTAARSRPTRLGPYEIDIALDSKPLAGPYRLIVMSHGTGGSGLGHHDTATALARAGFVVATFNHPYDNFADQSGAGTPRQLISRPRHIRAVVEQVLGSPAFGAILDQRRVGFFGFSAGGFAGLVAIGGVPDTARFAAYCAEYPSDALVCARQTRTDRFPAVDWRRLAEPRIAAAVIAAPALGFLFDGDGMAQVGIPMRLYRAEADELLPAARHVEPVARSLPTPVAPIVVPKAGHYVFLAPCSPGLQAEVPEICVDPPGVDRLAVHETMNADIVAFFRATLGAS